MEVNQRTVLLHDSSSPKGKSDRVIRRRRISSYNPIVWLSVACIVFLFLLGACLWIYQYISDTSALHDHELLEVKKCPACAGQSLCPYFFRREVLLPKTTQFPSSHFGIVGRIRHHPNSAKINLRRLGSPATPHNVDAAVCRRGTQQGASKAPAEILAKLPCIPHLAIWRWLPTNGHGVELPIHRGKVAAPVFNQFHPEQMSKAEWETFWSSQVMSTAYAPATRCSSDRLFSHLQSTFRERTSFGSETRWLRFDELMFLFQLAVDPQSVISQAFSRADSWPFPTYIGACGRWVAQNNHGVPLHEYCGSPLWKRMRIIRNILKLPELLNHPLDHSTAHNYPHGAASPSNGYSIYLGNFDLANVFTVDPTTFDVTISNLRHAIIVDTQMLWDLDYFNKTEHVVSSTAANLVIAGMSSHQCDGNISLAGDAGGTTPPCIDRPHSDQLCSHTHSDHNQWAVCTSLIHGHVSRTHPCSRFLDGLPNDLLNLLNQCVHEAQPGSRQDKVGKALTILDTLIGKS